MVSDLAVNERRADLDWLRVIAFGLLIYYHAAIAFIPGGIPMIQNVDSSVLLRVVSGFLHEFRLALLFLISGVGVAFALKRRNGMQFMRERAVRLLVPFVFGIFVIVPPMIFLEKLFIGEFTGSFAQFWSLTCLGYAGRYLQRPGRLLTYLNMAVYPLFCLHLTIIVALEYVIVPLHWSIPAKYLAVTTGTNVLALGSYELLWRRVAWLRPLVGLNPLQNQQSDDDKSGQQKSLQYHGNQWTRANDG